MFGLAYFVRLMLALKAYRTKNHLAERGCR